MVLTTGLRPIGDPQTGQSQFCAFPGDAVFEVSTARYASRLARNSGGGASIAGLASKKPAGFSMKPI